MTQIFKQFTFHTQKLILFRFNLFLVAEKRTVAGPTTVPIGSKMCLNANGTVYRKNKIRDQTTRKCVKII